jgi:CRP/FNR family transcriptional regulator, anaerobic regulatory protein
MMKEFSFDNFIYRLDNHPALKEQAVEKHYKKGSHVFVQGSVCKDVFCMRRGLLKLYYNTIEGKEWIKSFVADKGVVGSRSSQLLAKPSPFSVLCMEDTEIIRYPYELFQQVCSDDYELTQSLFGFTQWLGLKKEVREYQLLCLSAEEAYSEFLESNPKLLGRLTQIDIARYLGITPIALSRIKKRLA